MANRERTHKLIRGALFPYLGTGYAAAATTANSQRKAQVIGYAAQNFTIPTGSTLGVQVQGTEYVCALTAGTRTAAQVASDLNNAIGSVATASADSTGRVLIESDTAPAESTNADGSPALTFSTIGIVPSGSTAYSVLGFAPGQGERRAPVRNPGPLGFVWGPSRHRRFPDIECTRVEMAELHPVSGGLSEYSVLLTIRDGASSGDFEAPVELVERHIDIICDLIATDRSLGSAVISCFVDRVSPGVSVWEAHGGDFAPNYLFSEGAMELRVRVCSDF